MTRGSPHSFTTLPPADPSKVRGAALPVSLAPHTVRLVEAVDALGLDRESLTRVLGAVVAAHVQRFPNKTEAMAELVLVATRLAMGDR